ncbi:MAG: methyltransferase domain-containing protein [Candidatus Lokiarchaeota archaeon]|nr:methyltransferase domain-containing protein [Candidatus Lokiarchaeota archaeon]MBD3338265.1 methyltransferase domain-containing protein [Candidatus Lokiarchaeota archaeon]
MYNMEKDVIKEDTFKIDEEDMEFINLEWLLDHHRTKKKERRRMIAELGLKDGDKVLDLGCGPGLWTPMIAEEIAPHGNVVGVDFSAPLIEYAKKNKNSHYCKDIMEFRRGDFYDLPYDDDSFDVVFFGNCFAYVIDAARVLAEQKRLTKKGGRIIAKDFDGAIIVFYPIDPYLSSKILTATSKALKETPPDPPFDNYTGRKLNGLFLNAGLKKVSTKSYAIQKVSPLSAEAKRYIRGNAEWYADTGSEYISDGDFEEWMSHFDPTSDNYILNREDFYFCMLEVITQGFV